MRYAIWNNKGGVGKSFLTFVFASEYASANPDKVVYVIDMCPQANVSEIFLGGNGGGAIELEKLLNGRQRQTIRRILRQQAGAASSANRLRSEFFDPDAQQKQKKPEESFSDRGRPVP